MIVACMGSCASQAGRAHKQMPCCTGSKCSWCTAEDAADDGFRGRAAGREDQEVVHEPHDQRRLRRRPPPLLHATSPELYIHTTSLALNTSLYTEMNLITQASGIGTQPGCDAAPRGDIV